MAKEKEIWHDIKGWKGFYQISDKLRVKSLQRTITFKSNRWGKNKLCIRIIKERILHPNRSKGYVQYAFSKNCILVTWLRCRIIAELFLPKIKGKTVLNHKNGIRDDDRLENMEWVNRRENLSHEYLSRKKTSKYTGVFFHKREQKWRAQLGIGYKRIQLGSFKTELEAAEAYQSSLVKHGLVNKYLQKIAA